MSVLGELSRNVRLLLGQIQRCGQNGAAINHYLKSGMEAHLICLARYCRRLVLRATRVQTRFISISHEPFIVVLSKLL